MCNIAVVDEDNLNRKPIILTSSKVKRFKEADSAGSSIEYRCIKCRGCAGCRNGEFIEKISLKEEYEQSIINSSVKVDLES